MTLAHSQTNFVCSISVLSSRRISSKDEMQRAIDAFTNKVTKATEALFYFGGFGLQVDRRTYLLPVNAQIWNEADVRRDGISVDALLAEMHRRGAKVTVVIVDAARRNPFERRFRASPAGLAPLDAPEGTLAMFSAAPGVVTRDNDSANRTAYLSRSSLRSCARLIRPPNKHSISPASEFHAPPTTKSYPG